MVFASICEHASSAFIFASSSSDQFSHASSEHFVNFPPSGISLVLRRVIWLTLSKQDNRRKAKGNMIRPYRGSTIPSSLGPIMPCLICRLLHNYFT